MGNVDSRGKAHFGYLMLATDRPFYCPGEMITGKIYIRTEKKVDATHLELEVKGMERGSWIETLTRTVDNGDGT